MIMSPRTSVTVAKFKEGTTNAPLVPPFPLQNVPQLVSSNVPDDQTQGSASDASTLYMGNFRDLWLGIRTQFRLQVLQERYADNLQLGFLAWMRVDVQAAHTASLGRLIGIVP